MDLPTLPTTTSDNSNSPNNLDSPDNNAYAVRDDAAQVSGASQVFEKGLSVSNSLPSEQHALEQHGSEQPHSESENMTQTIDPNAIILAEALTDKAISWQIHNCKIIKKTVTQDLPLPFLYHYDSLDDTIKQAHPLTPELLTQFNTPMSAQEAANLIGINQELLTSPWHVKVIGSLVVFSESLQLAVRLHWTNTGKETQQVYTKDAADAITVAFKDWQFFGRVDVLYKNNKQTLISIDEQNPSTPALPTESLLTIGASSDYQQLLATHALAAIVKLEADKADLPWFDTAILARLE
ncbi:hypothetical protein ACTXGL_00940 [Psychrobacter sp. T6-6]|uniref:hypothetical protein n=1 Tax=Psychrobacter sp. T6-6 TaxID=3457452 RepID=UPI003FD10296